MLNVFFKNHLQYQPKKSAQFFLKKNNQAREQPIILKISLDWTTTIQQPKDHNVDDNKKKTKVASFVEILRIGVKMKRALWRHTVRTRPNRK